MLEDIGKLPKYKIVIDKPRAPTVLLYVHHSTLAMMQKYTKRRELVRPGVTLFVITFLSLSCLLDKKSHLAVMVLQATGRRIDGQKVKQGFEQKPQSPRTISEEI